MGVQKKRFFKNSFFQNSVRKKSAFFTDILQSYQQLWITHVHRFTPFLWNFEKAISIQPVVFSEISTPIPA